MNSIKNFWLSPKFWFLDIHLGHQLVLSKWRVINKHLISHLSLLTYSQQKSINMIARGKLMLTILILLCLFQKLNTMLKNMQAPKLYGHSPLHNHWKHPPESQLVHECGLLFFTIKCNLPHLTYRSTYK